MCKYECVAGICTMAKTVCVNNLLPQLMAKYISYGVISIGHLQRRRHAFDYPSLLWQYTRQREREIRIEAETKDIRKGFSTLEQFTVGIGHVCEW